MLKKALAVFMASIIFALVSSCPVQAIRWRLYVESYGTCRVTAYSGNNGVTYGASENILIPNKSCAASRNIPLGTELYIKDFGIVTVEDRMSEEYDNEHDGMVVDLYLESYDAACDWGMHELEVYIIKRKEVIEGEGA